MSRIDHHRPHYPDLFGQFRKSYHLEMVVDRARTDVIFRALRRTLDRDTVFCELGCGTGIFSIFAASRAKKVYAVELDPSMIRVAASNIQGSRFGHSIELIQADACDVELPEKAGVILCEMMSIWTIEEPQVPVFNHAFESLLEPGGIFLPMRIVNLAELGTYDFRFAEIEMKAAIPLFTGIPRPAVLTESRVARILDFSAPVSPDLGAEINFTALGEGRINCARLTSIVQMGPKAVFSGSDSLMPSTVVPVTEEIQVETGQRIRLRCSARARSDIGEASFHVEIVE